MDLIHTRDKARLSLENAPNHGKTLALVHCGITLGISFIITVLNLLLSRSIDGTSGLSGIGLRSGLESVKSLLYGVNMLALPFWQIGFLFAALIFARGESATNGDLLEGFRRFGKVLRLYLLQGIIYILLGLACLHLSSFLFFLTPYSDKLTPLLEPAVSGAMTTEQLLSDPVAANNLIYAMIPLYVIFAMLFLPLAALLFYRLRMAEFAIMDDAPGALAAFAGSLRMMRGNCISLFKTDLKFWWFFLLKGVAAIIAYGDMLLSDAGVKLPIHEDVLFFGFYGLYILLELIITWRCAAYIQTTYAHCYEELKANISRPAPMQQL